MITITVTQLLKKLTEVFDERGPDYKYELPDRSLSCSYHAFDVDGDPSLHLDSCLFGEVFKRLGVNNERLPVGSTVDQLLDPKLQDFLPASYEPEFEMDWEGQNEKNLISYFRGAQTDQDCSAAYKDVRRNLNNDLVVYGLTV